MQEKEDLGGVGVAFCEGEEVEVVVSDVEILFVERERGGVLAWASHVRVLVRSWVTWLKRMLGFVDG